MIKKILRSIRQKPQVVREQYAFWIASSLTGLVAMVWVMTNFGGTEVGSNSVATQEAAVANTDTLSDFISGAQNQISAVQQEVMEVVSSDVSSTRSIAATSSASTTLGATVATSTPSTTARPVTREVRIATTSNSVTPIGVTE